MSEIKLFGHPLRVEESLDLADADKIYCVRPCTCRHKTGDTVLATIINETAAKCGKCGGFLNGKFHMEFVDDTTFKRCAEFANTHMLNFALAHDFEYGWIASLKNGDQHMLVVSGFHATAVGAVEEFMRLAEKFGVGSNV